MRRYIAARGILTFGVIAAAIGGSVACSGGGAAGTGGTNGTGGANGGGGNMGAGTGGAGGARVFTKTGVCGQRGTATATATTYAGTEDKFLISETGKGEDVCVVKFDLKRVGAGQTGCTECKWVHMLEYSSPRTMLDVDGACAKRELPLDAAGIAQIVSSRIHIGLIEEMDGAHSNARMEYDASKQMYIVSSMATFDPATNTFGYEDRDGTCRY